MKWELLPMSNGGEPFTKPGIYAASRNGKIAALQFYNVGTNSTAVVRFGGIQLEIAPGDVEEITMQPFGYDVTDYGINFRVINPATASVNNLLILTQKYIEHE